MKKHFKSITIPVILLLLMALLTAGCSQPPQDSTPDSSAGASIAIPTDTSAENAPASTGVSDVADPLSQYIQTDLEETVTGSDNFRNKWSIPIRIPKLLPFSDDAIACQKEISDYFSPRITEIRNNSEQGFHPDAASIDYTVYLNGNILSVVICNASNFDLNTYLVYNFDTETGKRLDTETLMTKLQVTGYTDKIKQIIISHYEAMNTVMSSSIDPDFYNQQLAATTSKENLDKVMPYVEKDGSVKVIINIYGFAGAAYYPSVFSLT